MMKEYSDEEVRSALTGEAYHHAWGNLYRSAENADFSTFVAEVVSNAFSPYKAGLFLDAGCGTGTRTMALAAQGHRMVGVDFSPSAVEACRKRAESAPMPTQFPPRFEVGDLLRLPFQDSSFDGVVCWGVLMHIPSVSEALGELVRVLKPGGVLVLGELNMDAWQLKAAGIARRLLRRGPRTDTFRKDSGLETWDGEPGKRIVARKTDMAWLQKTLRDRGMQLSSRRAGEFTELYVSCKQRSLRRLLHRWNRFWYRSVRTASPALGNVLVFHKEGGLRA